LYGIIPLRKALEIYNKQNEPVAEEDFAAFSEVVRHEDHMYSILGEDDLYSDCNGPCGAMDREIIAEHVLIDEDDYEDLKAEQEGKPYYIPSKRTLLKYEDVNYYEQNAEFFAIRDFLHYHKNLTVARANDVSSDMQLAASMGEQDSQYILKDLARMGVKLKDSKEVGSFFDLYWELFNNTRMTFHRGHTPNEIYKDSGSGFDSGAGMAPLRGYTEFDSMHKNILKAGLPAADPKAGPMNGPGPTEPTKTDGINIVPLTENVSRNALCPCGSGKKYKHCCGLKSLN
jgi:hypothetical protein